MSKIKRLLCVAMTLTFLPTAASAQTDKHFWLDSEHKAIELQGKDPDAAIEMYKLAIEDAASENAPVEKQLGLMLNCANLMQVRWQLTEARELYEKGAKLAEQNSLPRWQARFLVMQSRSMHYMVAHHFAHAVNDPAIPQAALKLRAADGTDFHVLCTEAIGDAYLDQENYAQAERYLADALHEASRIPDEEDRIDEITRSFLLLRMKQGRLADATKIVVAFGESHPRELRELVAYFQRELKRHDSETSTIIAKGHELLFGKRFEELDTYADKLRSQKATLASGISPIDVLLEQLEPHSLDTNAVMQEYIRLEEEWLKQRPKSVTARVALANTLTTYAWKARGGGLADTVSDTAYDTMQKRLEQAYKILRLTEPRTADYYAACQGIALGLGWKRSDYDELVTEGRKKFPAYKTIVFDKAYYLQPKWYGGKGEAAAFIAGEANKLGGINGDVFYAQMAWNLDFSFANVIKDADFDWNRVKRGFAELLKRYPNSDSAKAEFLFLATQMRDKPTALAIFPGTKQASLPFSMHPRNYLDSVERAEDLYEHEKRPEAIAEYTKALAADPKGGEALLRRAELYLLSNKYKESLEDVNKALTLFPEWSKALFERGRIEQCMERYSESIKDLQTGLSLDPTDANALSTLASAYDELGNHQKAIDVATYAIELQQQAAPQNLYYSYQQRGLSWSNAHQFAESVDDLKQGIHLYPKWSQLWAYLAYALAATDHTSDALTAAKALTLTEKFEPRGHRLLGEMYRAGGNWEMALGEYTKSTSMEPTYGPGFWQKAVTELALGKYEEAETDLHRSVSLIPTSAFALSYLAVAQELNNKKEQADASIKQAIAITPDLPMIYINRARILLHRGELTKAAEDCNKALALDPYSNDAYATGAWILERAKMDEDARKFYRLANQMWWHHWQTPFPAPPAKDGIQLALKMPELKPLKPQPFGVSLRDAAP